MGFWVFVYTSRQLVNATLSNNISSFYWDYFINSSGNDNAKNWAKFCFTLWVKGVCVCVCMCVCACVPGNDNKNFGYNRKKIFMLMSDDFGFGWFWFWYITHTHTHTFSWLISISCCCSPQTNHKLFSIMLSPFYEQKDILYEICTKKKKNFAEYFFSGLINKRNFGKR